MVKLRGYDYQPCDITQRKNVQSLIKNLQPHYILNAAAYTNVDASEEDKEVCWRVNAIGPQNLAQAAKSLAAMILHVSTDYVFDGASGNYSEKSHPNPLGYYGRSKLAGENAVRLSDTDHLIVRTMILYGTGQHLKPNFVTWLINELQAGRQVRIVDDQLGQPTLVDDLAAALRKLVETNQTGVFHVAGSECVSRYDFAIQLADVFDFNKELIGPVTTEELNQKAPRPLNSSFDLAKLHDLGIRLSGVRDGLQKLKHQLYGRRVSDSPH